MSTIPIHAALTLALVESLGLALLLLRVKGVAGLRLLVLFLCGVGVWVLSAELPVWFGARFATLSAYLVALSSLTSAVFFHFVLVLCAVPQARRLAAMGYAAGGLATLAGLIVAPGVYGPWQGFDYFFMPNAMGWVVGIVWALLAVAGHAVLFWHWLQRRGPPRGQLVAMCLASGWGALCMAGYSFEALGLDWYPFPLLLLPVYPLILVYGILRYELMIVNAWARRALAWALLVALGSAAVACLTLLPMPLGAAASGWQLWLVTVAAVLLSSLLLDPFRRLATRIVYPGSQLPEGAAESWREALAGADSYAALQQAAEQAISQQLHLPIRVLVEAAAIAGGNPDQGRPLLLCRREHSRWHTRLAGWEAAPPGPRYVAQLFCAVLTEAAQRLDQVMAMAQRDRERQKQERLAELGSLAATVAHDIRNPLNIISMAAAMAPPEVRREIAAQTARISHLATDLLDYAKSWQIDRRPLDLADLVRTTAAGYAEFRAGPGLVTGIALDADPRRLGQALQNLLENARAAVAERGADGRIEVDLERSADGGLDLLVCDNGSGVPEEIRDTLFQPFVSRRADGTGLGLAIVAKILEAHGGSASLRTRAGWSSCFVLHFPAAAA